jgi:hypothetical protein
MRIEYNFRIDDVEVPCFAVEAVEGIGKVFTVATLVLNVLNLRPRVDLVFHGLNSEDPGRKIEAFRQVIDSAGSGITLGYEEGQGGGVTGSSYYYQWLHVRRGD